MEYLKGQLILDEVTSHAVGGNLQPMCVWVADGISGNLFPSGYIPLKFESTNAQVAMDAFEVASREGRINSRAQWLLEVCIPAKEALRHIVEGAIVVDRRHKGFKVFGAMSESTMPGLSMTVKTINLELS